MTGMGGERGGMGGMGGRNEGTSVLLLLFLHAQSPTPLHTACYTYFLSLSLHHLILPMYTSREALEERDNGGGRTG